MQQQNQPMAFEVQLPKTSDNAAAPAIKARLEKSSRKNLTLEEINEKQSKAAMKRAAVLEQQLSDVKESLTRVELVKERKTSEERAQAERMNERLVAAEAKRMAQISAVKDKAAMYNERVTKIELVKERKSSEERAQQERLAERLSHAEEKRTAQIEGIKDKAHMYNERVNTKVQHMTESSAEEAAAKKQ